MCAGQRKPLDAAIGERVFFGVAKAVLLDIDGVLTTSWQPLAGAVETMGWLKRKDIDFRLLTNSSSKSRRGIAKLLDECAMPVDPSHILTAVTSAARYLKERGWQPNCLVLNQGDITEDLDGCAISDAASADAVLLGGAGPVLGYSDFEAAFRLALEGIPIVALHRNLRYRTADGLALDMGAFIIGLEAAAGTEIPVVGKPAPAFFHAALDQLGREAADVVVVGDDIEADVFGAQGVGATGVLVKSGKFQPCDLEGRRGRPDHVIDTVGHLPDLFEQMRWL
jgi:HAD superfamily hydrolase (TIGR01458 family)